MNLALISFNQLWEDKPANMKLCEVLFRTAADNLCSMVVFPELTLTGFSMQSRLIAEEPETSPTLRWFREQAVKYSMSIVFGMVLETGAGKPANNLIALSHTGDILAKYQKIHLFSPAGEDKHYERGSEPAFFTFMGHDIGLTICYDLRFPEIHHYLSYRCSLIINSANWPASRGEHWNTLLKARAIENQVFFCGVNRVGTDGNNIEYEKSSYLFDPSGNRCSPTYSEDQIDIFTIDLSQVESVRTAFPFMKDRDLKLYYKLYKPQAK